MRHRRESGAVFIVTLIILGALTAIVASIAATENLVEKEEINRLDKLRARAAAEAGIQRAIEVLCDESSSGTVATPSAGANTGSNVNQPGAKTLQDDWATIGTTGTDRFTLKNSSFRLQIIDACSRINLNTATQAQLQNLPLLSEQVDSLLDWRSTGESPRPDGAKDDYYNGLQNPYDASLAPFSTVNELLDVRYFTPADLWDAPQNQGNVAIVNFADGRVPTLSEMLTVDSSTQVMTTTGTAMTRLSTVTQQQMTNRFGRTAGQQIYNARNSATWLALLTAARNITSAQLTTLLNTYYLGATTTLTGKVNVNTASQAVLQTIPGMSQDTAAAVVNYQANGATSMGAILNIPGLSTVGSLRTVLDSLTVNSSTFIVRVIGTSGTTTVPLEAIVNINSTQNGQTTTAKILRMEEQPFSDMTGRWGWQTTTNNDVPLEANS